MSNAPETPSREPEVETYPLLPLPATVVFPGVSTTMTVARPGPMLALADLHGTEDRLVFAVLQRAPSTDAPMRADLHDCGTVASIVHRIRLPNRQIRVEVMGVRVARLNGVYERGGEILAEVLTGSAPNQLRIDSSVQERVAVLLPTALNRLGLPISEFGDLGSGIDLDVHGLDRLTHKLAALLDVSTSQKQALLEVNDPVVRFNEIIRILGK